MYKFAKKYGTNVDGYSPIYTPDSWSSGGGSYKLGVKGLIAWYVPAPAVSCVWQSNNAASVQDMKPGYPACVAAAMKYAVHLLCTATCTLQNRERELTGSP